uniref:Nibrin n=1 Tax=Poecilia formosa TaxID=48698 RepID=A0A096M638_POEFO
GETFYLLPGKEYVVGRKNCDILLASDQSISRSHAQLTVTDLVREIKNPTLTLKDTSKYGTFVNSQQLTAPVELSSGDNVAFGVFHSKFSVVFLEKPVVCSSCLDVAGKTSLSQALSALGGKLVSSWTPDCTHLAMPTVKVTIKTISALLCGRPIVKPEYFSELSRAVQQKSAPPKPESFVPEIDEPSLRKEDVKLATTSARKQLFTGKTFVFLTSKQLKRLGAAVSFGGGSSRLLEEGSLPRDLLESPHSCVVEVTTGSSQTLLPPSATEWANAVKNITHRKGLRVITESEIGLAAIYASCDKYCNPSCLIVDSDPVQKVKPRIPSASLSQSVTVDETVLPAASQNITAYAVNTETSQSAADSTDSQRRKPDPKPKEAWSKLFRLLADLDFKNFNSTKRFGNTNFRPPPSAPKTNGGSRTILHTQSSQKQKTSPQTSPQKQSTLTNFFQPVNKKRPLEEESSDIMSAPKRPAPESSASSKDTNSLGVSKKMPSLPLEGPSAVSETPLESASDLFSGRAERLEEEPRSRKRKEMEEEVIKMEELESIMSEDMDYLGDESPSGHGQKEEVTVRRGLAKQMQSSHTVESSAKKQRVYQEQTVGADIPQPAEETRAAVRPVQIKEEVKESKVDEDLPKKLLMVEFRSLTVTAPSKPKPKQPQNNGHAKNFKCFRKKHLPGAEGFPHIIGGSDLLVHNRGTNSDLDEWLKGAAEGERQNKREEAIGDDLFRYNPTKLTKRR